MVSRRCKNSFVVRAVASQVRVAGQLALLAVIAASASGAEAPEPASARHLYLAGKYAEAAEAYQALAGDAPVEAAVGLARCQVDRGELAVALATLTAALNDHPKSAPLHAELAGLLFGQGKHDEAR